MTDEMALEALKWIVHDIMERKEEVWKERNKNEFEDGRSLAYEEVIDMVQSRLDILGINMEQIEAEEG